MLLLMLSGLPGAVYAAQTCHSESEVPASTPTARFSDHGDGTLTDTQTGLMWAKCAEGMSGAGCTTGSASSYAWEGALNAASASTLAAYSNWRLPNITELRSTVEGQCISPAINLSVFPNTPALIFWSASPWVDFQSFTWNVDFSNGYAASFARINGALVRLVRSGQ
jgi:hypothetical protein